MGTKQQNDWLYQVIGVEPYATPYAPELTKIPESWLREVPEWFYTQTTQYSGWVSDGKQYGDKGRFAALIANWDQCYLNVNSVCFKPPQIQENERFVYQGNVETLEDTIVPVSILAATKGHPDAMDPKINTLITQGWLDDNGQPLTDSPNIMAHQLIQGRYLNLPEGIAFVGAIFPHVPEDMVARINASAISGTWILDKTVGHHIFTGAAFVNKGALPLGHKDELRFRRDASDFELRNIAASARYDYIMAVDITESTGTLKEHECSCKNKQGDTLAVVTDEEVTDREVTDGTLEKVDAASDPTIGEESVVLSLEELSSVLSELIGRVGVLEDQVAGIDKAVVELIRFNEAREEI